MERNEIQKLLAVIDTVYPNFKVKNASATVDAWNWALEDYDYNTIALALKTYIRTSGEAFPPNVSQLIAMTRKPVELTELNEAEAWALVRKAVKNGIYGYNEEYDKLPEIVKKAVGTPEIIREWATINSDELTTVIASNFNRNYRTIVQREREYTSLPVEVKTMLEATTNNMIEVNHDTT